MSEVSVVMPARNAEVTIASAISSVLSQSHLGQLIIVEDGSSDATRSIAESFADPRIQIIDGPCKGFAYAFNKGLESVACPFFAQCDSDDLFTEGRLAQQLEWLLEYNEYCAISGGYQTIMPSGKEIALLACDQGEFDATEALSHGRVITTFCSWLIRTETLRSVKPMREWFVTGCDIDLQFRIAGVGRIWHHPSIVYKYRLHDGSVTHQISEIRRQFFDEQAVKFALQRLERGTDDLEDGCQPAPPGDILNDSSNGRAMRQALGQMNGLAWRTYNGGKKFQAMRLAFGMIWHSPMDKRGWASLCAMTVRIFMKAKI